MAFFTKKTMLGTLFYTITAKTEPLKQKLGEAQASMSKTDQTMRATSKSVTTSSAKMSGSAGNALGTMTNGLNSVSPAAGGAVNAMKSMSMGARALNVALGPIGIILAAIIIAVKALTAYFKGSADGQQKFAVIMAYLGGVADALKDAFIALGRWIVWAFENPKDAVKDLWEMIKTNFINRFKGMVDMITSGWKVISQGAKGVGQAIAGIFSKDMRAKAKESFKEMAEGMQEFGKAAFMASTGIDLNSKKLLEFGKAAAARAKAAADLQRRENALQMVQIGSLTKIATLDKDIAELRLITNDTTAEGVKRLEAANRVEELIAQKYDMKLAMAKEERDIQRERNALGESTLEDIKKEAELSAEIIRLSEARANEERALLRIKGSVTKEIEAQREAELKALNDVHTARALAQAEELEGRQEIMRVIEDAGKSEVDKLYDQLNEKLNAYQWSKEEELRITQYYAGLITEVNRKEVEAMRSVWDDFAMVIGHGMASAFDELGAALTGAQADFRSLAASALDSISQIINALLGKAIAAMIAGEASKGLVGLAFAAVGVGALKAMFAQNIPKMAAGGIVPPGYPNDTYPALLSSGETVTPPRALATSGGVLTARIDKGDLLFTLEQARNQFNQTF